MNSIKNLLFHDLLDYQFIPKFQQINIGCEAYRFISGLDEMALPSEIGLYFDFEVTDDGIPYGCPGFEIFDSVHFNWTQYRGCMYI